MNGSNLSNICNDLFLFILYLRQSRDLEQPDAIYNRSVNLFNSMEEQARGSNIADEDIQDAKYALAAFIDETVGWASRLEVEFCGSNVAGEEFFSKLEQIKEAGGRDGVLEVYYLCLTLGFEGRYFSRPERIQEYINNYQQISKSEAVKKLSPHAERPQETIKRQRRGGIPSWLPWAATAVGAVVVGFVSILLKLSITSWAGNVINQIQSFLH